MAPPGRRLRAAQRRGSASNFSGNLAEGLSESQTQLEERLMDRGAPGLYWWAVNVLASLRKRQR